MVTSSDGEEAAVPTSEPTGPAIRGLGALIGVLRALGATCFVAAGASFLVEGWADSGVLQRQLLWGGGTVLMTIFGVFAARRYRDPLGARMCLGLAAATLPVHFAQLGAAVWALRLEGLRVGASVLFAGLTVLALGPVLALGLSALARSHARRLVGLLFAVSAPLLVPTRDGDLVAAFSLVQVAVLLAAEIRTFGRDPLFRTLEGYGVRAILVLPWVIMSSRNLYYASTPCFRASLVGLPALVVLVVPALWPVARGYRAPLQAIGVAGVAMAVGLVSPSGAPLAMALGVVAVGGAEISEGTISRLLGWAGAVALACCAGLAWVDPDPLLALSILPLGVLHVVSAYRRRAAWQLAFALGLSLIACAGHLRGLVVLPAERLWVPGVIGSVVLLAAASAAERHRGEIERIVGRLRTYMTNGQPL
ncbi:MAG: hypothetical protein OXU20_27305 [Myxococcales bacterium]|nr:hypothetical protein [Myxococcales bacterium]MDD9971872.1 hypothetical protein [Myxococcales bacterium]